MTIVPSIYTVSFMIWSFRLCLPHGSKASTSLAARLHGRLRHEQGYSIPMIVDESRILELTIFGMLLKNLASVDFSGPCSLRKLSRSLPK
jgi:hypothetical protein